MAALAKLAFIHRTLWARDRTYRIAAMLGPPPLLGGGLALAIWSVVHTEYQPGGGGREAPWVQVQKGNFQSDEPVTLPPTKPLPPPDEHGGFIGYRTGWVGHIHPMTVDATMDANVLGMVQGAFAVDQATIPLSLILDAGPPSGLFVGSVDSYFAARSEGLYALSVRFSRNANRSANCLIRFSAGTHRIVRNINLNSSGDVVLTYPPAEFRLQPGLYVVSAAVGCWRGDQMIGPGELTLMVRHPQEVSLRPAGPDEAIKPAPLSAR